MNKSPFWSGKDAVGREVLLPMLPERIISLVPSQTELLIDLGVGSRLVGRTRYCIHPEARVSSIAEVGGTKRADLGRIQALKPDLIIAEKEENPRDLVESLALLAPVYVTDVVSIPSALSMCREVGQIVGLEVEAAALVQRIELALRNEKVISKQSGRPTERVLYLIWRKPWMAAGEGTFIHSCLEEIGFENAVTAGSSPGRYPELTDDGIANLRPDRVFLSSEPFPFQETHALELRELLPDASIEFVEGELFSWYGSRMLKMPAYWRSLLESHAASF